MSASAVGKKLSEAAVAATRNSEYHCVDTRVFDRCIQQKDEFIRRYSSITTRYHQIIRHMEWYGEGALAFIEDANKVRTNLTGIGDILSTMCNVLEDCRTVIEQADKELGEVNRNPDQ